MAVGRVGILGLQGDFARHRASLEALGVEAPPVRLAADLEGLDALVLPGGESTTMLTLIEAYGLRAPLAAFLQSRPVMGTCAGLILLGRGSEWLPAPPFGALDVTVERNAYGRQVDSFAADVEAPVVGGRFHAVFIRAPRISGIGAGVEVIARRLPGTGGTPEGEPVAVRQRRVVGLCFHPELTGDLRFHRWFLAEVAGLAGIASGDSRPAPSPMAALSRDRS